MARGLVQVVSERQVLLIYALACIFSMTYKRIEYDPHAIARMKQRGFSRRDVRWLLTQGHLLATEGSRQHRGGRVRGRDAKVAYLEDSHRIYVITVMWLDR